MLTHPPPPPPPTSAQVEIKGKRTGSWQACYEAAKWEVWVLIGAGLAVGLLYGYAAGAPHRRRPEKLFENANLKNNTYIYHI